jgi:ABC-2 type transport system ATP-binding protein
VLEAQGLVKRYGDCLALDTFSLTVQEGEIAGLIGHNGAGKTTFVEVVTGLVRPDGGELTIGGIDALRRSRAARRLLASAPQEIALYASATVRDHLFLFGSLAGVGRKSLRRAATRVAEELHLVEVLDRRVGLLSGGQRRRTQVATALISNVQLLILDEPTAGADPETRAALLRAVRARADQGMAVLYTTHYLPELVELQATLAVARAGAVIARGSQEDLTKGLVGELRLRTQSPIDHARLTDELRARIRTSDGELRVASVDPPADLATLLAAGCEPTWVDVRRPDLDDLYRSLALEAPHVA